MHVGSGSDYVSIVVLDFGKSLSHLPYFVVIYEDYYGGHGSFYKLGHFFRYKRSDETRAVDFAEAHHRKLKFFIQLVVKRKADASHKNQDVRY
jgi:hypothetical protein